MPIYKFQCLKCQHVYEDICSFDEGKYPGVSCPECKSKKKKRNFDGCNVVIKGTSSTSPDVAFGYKMEKAQDERRRALDASHMGDGGYNSIDDLNNDDNWGEVK